MKSLFLVTIAFMIYVTLEAAAPGHSWEVKLAEKPIRMAGRKFLKGVGYNQVNNLLKKRDVEIDNGAGSVPINGPDKENTIENTESKIVVNKANDDMNDVFGNYNGIPYSTSSFVTRHPFPIDPRPGDRY